MDLDNPFQAFIDPLSKDSKYFIESFLSSSPEEQNENYKSVIDNFPLL